MTTFVKSISLLVVHTATLLDLAHVITRLYDIGDQAVHIGA